MSNATKYFIIVFDRVEGRQVSLDELASMEEATEKYRQLEREFMDDRIESSYDVVLVGSDSLDSVKVTHASYFGHERADMSNLKRYLDAFANSNGAGDVPSHRIRSPRVPSVQPQLA